MHELGRGKVGPAEDASSAKTIAGTDPEHLRADGKFGHDSQDGAQGFRVVEKSTISGLRGITLKTRHTSPLTHQTMLDPSSTL